MAQYTENYNLHQWEPTDDFLRTDFNEDFFKIDATLAEKLGPTDRQTLQAAIDAKAVIAAGTYTGNGNSTQSIELDFQPSAVFVWNGNDTYMSLPGHPVYTLTVTDTGFQVSYVSNSGAHMNNSGTVYSYLALK